MTEDKMNILIVDDNPEMRQILAQFIRPICQNIHECRDGIYALHFYRKYKPDWVLMDWQMREMNGISASKEILKRFPDAHICMVTSFDDGDLRDEALKAGIEKFVTKDNLTSLREILKKQ